MKINKIKVSNFKSFKDLDLELGKFNVIIGANASGKSNFVQIFRFLRDIEQNNLRNAISMHGGISSLCNIPMWGKELYISFSLKNEIGFGIENLIYVVSQTNAAFSLKPTSSSKGFVICENEFSQIFNLPEQKKKEKEKEKEFWKNLRPENAGTITIKMQDNQPEFRITPPEIKEKLEKFLPFPPLEFWSKMLKTGDREEFLFYQRPFPFFPGQENYFSSMGIYDIDAHSAKNPVKITGKAELEEDGKNLALVLNHILEIPDKKRKLGNLLNFLLPFVDGIDTEKFAEKSLLLTLHEKYYNRDLRADLLSDGTVSLATILIALYFENKDVIFLEEPERNIHPHLISGLVEMMKESSQNKQVIVTTHSPEIIKHAGIENILLVTRDKDGLSTITRPADKKEIQVFLKNEIGLDELYIQNLLTA